MVDWTAVRSVRDALLYPGVNRQGLLAEILDVVGSRAGAKPLPRRGRLEPVFLGLIPTRACNLSCGYCGFQPGSSSQGTMDLALARTAVDWYLELAGRLGLEAAEVHFFGGEPFCAAPVMDLAVHYAQIKAAEVGCQVRFEVATNGALDEDRCRWAADSLDSIVLSFDGQAEVQDRQRPYRGGQGSFQQVVRSARILSEGQAELSFRTCVTAETVDRMPEFAAWLCQEYRPVAVCFEPVQPTARSRAAGLAPPDPWDFARRFVEAAAVLESFAVEAVYAAADIRAARVSFCPVGKDAMIVSPDGTVSACYLLQEEWEKRGLDLVLGRVENGSVSLDAAAVARARRLNIWNKPFCQRCFGKWHCAGGCHVNHVLPGEAGAYGRLCIQTRILTLGNILKAMGRQDLVDGLLQDPASLARAINQPSDRIADVERTRTET